MPTSDPTSTFPHLQQAYAAAILSAAERHIIPDTDVAVREAGRAVSEYVEGLETEVVRLREVLEDMARQFAYPGMRDGRLVLSDGGLSALEGAFDALGWPDPKPCPERECEADGCFREATTGTPTPNGYKRLCFDHYREVNHVAAQRGCAADGGE